MTQGNRYLGELDLPSALGPLVECVPNISEGRDSAVIADLIEEIARTGAKVLHVDSSFDAHRSVLTFVGSPQKVQDAAVRLCLAAERLIDMRNHRGAHPRLGAVDVLPFIPLSQYSLEDCSALAATVGRHVAEALAVPVFLYGAAARVAERENLATIRRGGYESLAKRLANARWQPDFGPATPHSQFGALVVGSRNILIAYNVNLDSTDLAIASEIASRLRQKSEHLRALGWSMPEYGCVQVSMNLLDFRAFGLFEAFRACELEAKKFGVSLRGSELVGLLPRQALRDAGGRFSPGDSLAQQEAIAVEALGLASVTPFVPEERVLEELLCE